MDKFQSKAKSSSSKIPSLQFSNYNTSQSFLLDSTRCHQFEMPELFLCKHYIQSTAHPNVIKRAQASFPLLELKLSKLKDFHQVHAQMIKTGFIHHTPSLAALLSLCLSSSSSADSSSFAYACTVFNHAQQLDSLTWNKMLRGFVDCNSPEMAIRGYLDMLQDADSSTPDRFTFPSLLKACGQLAAMSEGRALHGQTVKLDLDSDPYVQTTLLNMYSACGDVTAARTVFEHMNQDKNKVAWTSMICGYAKNQCPREALLLFAKMEEEGLEADEVTIASAVAAAAEVKDLELGIKLHRRINHTGMTICKVIGSALVDLYAKCGEVDAAREVFEALPERNVVAWSAMISGYAHNGRPEEAVELFKEMLWRADQNPNEMTVTAALSACAQTGDLVVGKWIHAYTDREELRYSTNLSNSLVNMYSKCGKIDEALEIFDGMQHKNIVSWNSIISGLAVHGFAERALAQFHLMQKSGIEPDGITFVGVLSACSHGGLVEEGFGYFHDMEKRFGIAPKLEHYGCMVDVLSRAGMLEEAWHFIKQMPMAPNGAVWGALLSGCRVHNNVDLGEMAAERLLEIEPSNDGVYVLLSNVFARKKNWEGVRRVRSLMHQRGIRKTPGCSSIVVGGTRFEFTVADHSHPEWESIQAMLGRMNAGLRAAGYVPDTSQVLLNIEEEGKKDELAQHSERLALCFGLIKIAPEDEILILKNLRVCRDCHTVMKLVSELFRRRITVRDRSRFHHFRNGSCSCNDYW